MTIIKTKQVFKAGTPCTEEEHKERVKKLALSAKLTKELIDDRVHMRGFNYERKI